MNPHDDIRPYPNQGENVYGVSYWFTDHLVTFFADSEEELKNLKVGIVDVVSPIESHISKSNFPAKNVYCSINGHTNSLLEFARPYFLAFEIERESILFIGCYRSNLFTSN